MKIPSKNIKLLVLCCAFFFSGYSSFASNCTIDAGPATNEFSAYSSHIEVTQIFTACEDGPLNSYAFSLANHGYEARGVSVSIAPYIPAVTGPSSYDLGTFDIIPKETGSQETFTFIPTTVYNLTKGEAYKITMIMNIRSSWSNNGISSGRSGGFEFGQTSPTNPAIGAANITHLTPLHSDPIGNGRMMTALAFKVDLGKPLSPIPTMSSWGLMIFALLVINGGLYFVRKLEWV